MHEVHKKDWEGSSDCSDFNQLIESMDDIFRFPITNIVILAGNSFHGGSEALLEGWCNARAHAQLAVLHTIRKKLSKFSLFIVRITYTAYGDRRLTSRLNKLLIPP